MHSTNRVHFVCTRKAIYDDIDYRGSWIHREQSGAAPAQKRPSGFWSWIISNDYYDPNLKRKNAEQVRQIDNATVIEGDIRDAELMRKLFKSYGVRRVAHLAAMAGVRSSVEQAETVYGCQYDGHAAFAGSSAA